MARQSRISTRLSAASLVHLGAPRLADLLIEAGAGNANLKRRLRLELAAEISPDILARARRAGCSTAWTHQPESPRQAATCCAACPS